MQNERSDVLFAPRHGPLADLRLGLTGHGHDDELGLIDLKGRIYDPVLKRVLTPDPLVAMPLFGQAYNRFRYVLNDPMNLVDPTGYQAGSGPDCSSCQLWVVPPIVDGGGIPSGSGSTAWGSVPQKTDWGEFQSLPSPPVQASMWTKIAALRSYLTASPSSWRSSSIARCSMCECPSIRRHPFAARRKWSTSAL
jgi:RHS repeat-associated protein